MSYDPETDIAHECHGRPPVGLDEKIEQAHFIVTTAIHRHVTMKEKSLVGRVVMFSGGNDSTVLAHLMRSTLTHFGHANTGIGVEATREFVRDLADEWGVPLLERSPQGDDTYESLVLDQGFPGPGQHGKMYQRLKERCFRQIRADLVRNGRRERVLFIGGRRRAESDRREQRQIPEMEQGEGAIVWCSPLVHWKDDDMAEYRRRFDVPTNPVTEHLHMSGECLCGAFAKPGELEMVRFFYPLVAEEIEALGRRAADAGVKPERCEWGWGAYRNWTAEEIAEFRASMADTLCSACSFNPATDRSTT